MEQNNVGQKSRAPKDLNMWNTTIYSVMQMPIKDLETRKEYFKNYYRNHKKRKFDTNRIWRRNNPDKFHASARKSSRNQRIKIKLEIVQLLGGKCSNPNCAVPNGMTDIRCLQIDHVHGGGNKQRRKYKGNQDRGSHYYCDILKKIKAGSKDYQLLCANCNWIKRYENGETGNRWGRKITHENSKV